MVGAEVRRLRTRYATRSATSRRPTSIWRWDSSSEASSSSSRQRLGVGGRERAGSGRARVRVGIGLGGLGIEGRRTGSEYCAVSSSPATRACTRCHDHLRRAGWQAELPQIVVGRPGPPSSRPAAATQNSRAFSTWVATTASAARAPTMRASCSVCSWYRRRYGCARRPVEPEQLPAAQGDRRRERRHDSSSSAVRRPGPHDSCMPRAPRSPRSRGRAPGAPGVRERELGDELERLARCGCR